MKKRSGFQVMARLIRLVKPLTGFMLLAILMGLVGHLCAAFITIFGGYAVLEALHFDTPFTLTALFACVVAFAVVRGFLRYAEQACNHFIAFKLLALLRDRVFRALRRSTSPLPTERKPSSPMCRWKFRNTAWSALWGAAAAVNPPY